MVDMIDVVLNGRGFIILDEIADARNAHHTALFRHGLDRIIGLATRMTRRQRPAIGMRDQYRSRG